MKRIITRASLAAMILAAAALNASAQAQYKDIFELIRGRVPGVIVGQASAGSTPRIYIRGIGTNSDQTQPLFIVDGLEMENVSSIDPNNVYEIDVIKDGTASIYGMKGANGVILITTKAAMEAAQQQAAAKKAARLEKKKSKKK